MVRNLIIILAITGALKTYGMADSNQLPSEVWGQVFHNLNLNDLTTASFVCHNWRQTADSSAIWQRLFMQQFGSYALPYVHKNEPYKSCYKRWLSEDFLHIEEWPTDKLIAMLKQDNDNACERKLIKQLEQATIARAAELKLTSPQQVVSFCVAHYMVNLETVHEGASWAAGEAASFAGKNWAGVTASIRAWNTVQEYAFIAPSKAASYLTKNACGSFQIFLLTSAPWEVAATINKPAWSTLRKAAEEAVKSVLTVLKLQKHKEIGEASFKLAILYALAYVISNEAHQEKFKTVFNAVLMELQKYDPAYFVNLEALVGPKSSPTSVSPNNLYFISMERLNKALIKQAGLNH